MAFVAYDEEYRRPSPAAATSSASNSSTASERRARGFTFSCGFLVAPLSTAQPGAATVPPMPKPLKSPGLAIHRRRQVESFTQLATRIPRSLRHRLRLVCADHGRVMQAFVTEALQEYLRRRQRE